MQLGVHERIIMKNAFNDERLDGGGSFTRYHGKWIWYYRLKDINATIKSNYEEYRVRRLKQRTNLLSIARVNLYTRSSGSIVSFFSFVSKSRYKTNPLVSLLFRRLSRPRQEHLVISPLPIALVYTPNSPRCLSLVKYNFLLYAYKFVIYICRSVVIKLAFYPPVECAIFGVCPFLANQVRRSKVK